MRFLVSLLLLISFSLKRVLGSYQIYNLQPPLPPPPSLYPQQTSSYPIQVVQAYPVTVNYPPQYHLAYPAPVYISMPQTLPPPFITPVRYAPVPVQLIQPYAQTHSQYQFYSQPPSQPSYFILPRAQSSIPSTSVTRTTSQFMPLLPPEPSGMKHPEKSHLNHPFPSQIQQQHSNNPIDPIELFKHKIFASVQGFNALHVGPHIYDLKSFLYNLPSDKQAASLSSETHLNLLVELALKDQKGIFNENLMDYFFYIKLEHLQSEPRTARFYQSIDSAIIQLIGECFTMPEIVRELLKIVVADSKDEGRSLNLFTVILNTVLKFEGRISSESSLIANYLSTLESVMEFVPLPINLVLLGSNERSASVLRTILHLTPIYKAFLGVQENTQKSVDLAIYLMDQMKDGSKFVLDTLTTFYALDLIVKRAFARMLQAEPAKLSSLLTRFDLMAKGLVATFSLENCYCFVERNLFHLLDIFIFFNSEDEAKHIDFSKMMILAYANCGPDKFYALKHFQIYLSSFLVSLENFRLFDRSDLINAGIDEHFLLILETIIAATEDVSYENSDLFKTWEPNRNFLLLQEEIHKTVSKKFEKFHILETPLLFIAAKVFLSRQLGIPISFFASREFMEGFSWADAVTFINFFYDRFCDSLQIKSQFCEDLITNFKETPTFTEMMTIFDSKDYPLLINEQG